MTPDPLQAVWSVELAPASPRDLFSGPSFREERA